MRLYPFFFNTSNFLLPTREEFLIEFNDSLHYTFPHLKLIATSFSFVFLPSFATTLGSHGFLIFKTYFSLMPFVV
jgi:hypothetical protein